MVGRAIAVARLISFNIQHGRTRAGAVDIDALARACASFDADVLALQEVDDLVPRSGRIDVAERVAEATGMTHAFGEAMKLGRRARYGNALLVRGGLQDVEVVALPHHPEREPRCAVIGRWAEGPMSVASCHLGLRGDAPAQLRVVVAALLERPGPHALLGDLNLDPRNVMIEGLTVLRSGPTFPAHRPRRTIDHIAVDGLDAVSITVLDEQPVSDHRPLAVEVRRPVGG